MAENDSIPTVVMMDECDRQVEVELMDISACEVEVSEEVTTHQAEEGVEVTDQQLLRDEIKEEEMEDADASQDVSQQGKRLLLKDWLIQKLDSEEMPDILRWYDKSESLFRIKWLHKATDSWEVFSDGVLFKEWCIHTGRYDPNNENPRKWKANFRCALNSLPDVIIVPTLCVRKGKDAYRVFKILPEKIPEKVREKQESSRKRRREKRESLLKAYAKNQADLGNMERAEAITKQIAVNPSNIKIHLKRSATGTQRYQSLLTLPLNITSPAKIVTQKPKSSTTTTVTTTSTTTSRAKTLLNGMDALCTAAAMMADKPGGEGQEADETDGKEVETEIINSAAEVEMSPIVSCIVSSSVSTPSGGDVVTYYRPVGPIQLANREKPTSVITLKSPSVRPSIAVRPAVSVTSPITLASGVGLGSIPLFKPVNPMKLGSASISTSTGNVLLSVRLAQPVTSTPSTPPKIIQQSVQIPHIPGYPPGVCLQPFSSPTTVNSHNQTPTYLIPKTFLQQQIAASAGNQPARVYTVKPAKVDGAYARLNETTANQRAKPISGLRLTSTDVAYSHLKANIASMLARTAEGKDLPFQLCKNSELIKVFRMYDSDKPNVEVSLTIQLDYTFNVVVHNRNLPAGHELLKKHTKTIKAELQFRQLLERIGKYVTCIGNPEEMAHRQYTDYSSFISAFQEPDLGAKNSVLRYHSTIRSNSCNLLLRTPDESLCASLSEDEAKECYRCDECSRIRTHVLSMRGLFSLLDGSKVPDTETARRKRLQLLKDYTTKEVLANRVDILETQIKRYQQLLPTDLQSIVPVTTVSEEPPHASSIGNAHIITDPVDSSMQSIVDPSTQYVTSISESVEDGEVHNVIRVTLASNDTDPQHICTQDISTQHISTQHMSTHHINAHISSSLSADDAAAVYHIVDAAANESDIMLVADHDNIATTEQLLAELAQGTLGNT